MNTRFRFAGISAVQAVLRRRSLLVATSALAVALLCAPAQAQQAKTLKLKNSTSQPVEYGLHSTGQPPLTTIVIRPGETRMLYPVPDRDALWYRYRATTGWATPYSIPFFQDPVYKWKFVSSGAQPGLIGAPEIP
jgi:hypothetical protein